MKTISKENAVVAYKVFDANWECLGYKFAVGTTYTHVGSVVICSSGFHSCRKLGDCFSYYAFDPQNKVAEVRIWGSIDEADNYSKLCSEFIEIVRELTWPEVLFLANTGANNTGHSNSGDMNSGDRNSGSWNSGDMNTGHSNSGNRNSGDMNSGDMNSGSWNSGSWNSGYMNSGYRSSGAFCCDEDPELYLFDKPSGMTVKEWEKHPAMHLLDRGLETHFWVNGSDMTDKEKTDHPGWESREGYLRSVDLKAAWANMWRNLDGQSRQIFLDLPNFDAEKFKTITGIKIEGDE